MKLRAKPGDVVRVCWGDAWTSEATTTGEFLLTTSYGIVVECTRAVLRLAQSDCSMPHEDALEGSYDFLNIPRAFVKQVEVLCRHDHDPKKFDGGEAKARRRVPAPTAKTEAEVPACPTTGST